MALVHALLVFRHGQRPPYPPPPNIYDASEDAADGMSHWAARPFPNASSWGMNCSDFQAQRLSPAGVALLRHLGEHVRAALPAAAFSCATPPVLLADDYDRDEQSAKAWYRRGQACLKLGQHEAARKNLTRACQLAPGSREIREEIEKCKKAAATVGAPGKFF